MTPGGADLDVVIVNWNGGKLLHACVSSLLDEEAPSRRVVVVDNASTDGSAETLPTAPSLSIQVNGNNAGFGRACNQGAAVGRASAILFLNPDTQAEPGSLAAALAPLTGGRLSRSALMTKADRRGSGDVRPRGRRAAARPPPHRRGTPCGSAT